MGRLQADEMSNLLDLDAALMWHLQHNHYPPVPLAMVQPCKDAIGFAEDGEAWRSVTMPDGITYRGEDSAPAFALIETFHLDSFISDVWEDY